MVEYWIDRFILTDGLVLAYIHSLHKGHHTRSNFCRATSRATKVSPCMVQSSAVASRLKHVCDMLREIETILFSGDLSYETCDKSCLRRSDKSCSVWP